MGNLLSRCAPVSTARPMVTHGDVAQRALCEIQAVLKKHSAVSAFDLLRDALKQTPEGRALLFEVIANRAKGPQREMTREEISNVGPVTYRDYTEAVETMVDAGVGVGLIEDAREERWTTTAKCEAALRPFKSKTPDARPFRSSCE